MKKCYYKPNRTQIRHFSERAVGRIVAYARRDGANDAILIAQILEGFGVRALACGVYKILDVLNTTVFLGALVALLKGLLTIVKGISLLSKGKSRIVTSFLEFIVPKKWSKQLGVWLLWIGSAEVFLSSTIIFLTALANNFAIYLLARNSCQASVVEINIGNKPIDLGTLVDDLGEYSKALKKPSEIEQP